MASILSGLGESWRDALRDVVLIVVSIVIAFAVDAWWDDRGEAVLERRYLASLVAEFRGTQAELTEQLRIVGRSSQASEQVLRLTADPAPDISPDSLAQLINTSFNVGVPALEGGALRALLASGGLSILHDERLTALLAEWPLVIERIQSNAALLVQNREAEITDYMVAVGAPIARVAEGITWWDLPRSRSELVPDQLLNDVAFESLFVSRRIRTQFLRDSYLDALAKLDDILPLLTGGSDT